MTRALYNLVCGLPSDLIPSTLTPPTLDNEDWLSEISGVGNKACVCVRKVTLPMGDILNLNNNDVVRDDQTTKFLPLGPIHMVTFFNC